MDISTDFEAENLAMAEALAFCRANRWLIDADPLIAEMMRSATTDLGFKTEPDPARAIVVMSNSYSYSEPGDETRYGWRKWWYLSDIDGCATPKGAVSGQLAGNCHRCSGSPLDIWDRKPAVATVHIPRGRFAVEFALCHDCMTYLASLADAITKRSRIASGDTYVEFERTARVGEDDTEV